METRAEEWRVSARWWEDDGDQQRWDRRTLEVNGEGEAYEHRGYRGKGRRGEINDEPARAGLGEVRLKL